MKILGIESSCDETAAAVVENGVKIFSNVVASQVDIHARYGGIVPEVASRQHLLSITPIVQKAMDDAQVGWKDIAAIAVTNGPGLAGSLLVGLSMAKTLAWAHGLSLVGVNHLEGHIYANWLIDDVPGFPLICLIVSGGHTDEDIGVVRYGKFGEHAAQVRPIDLRCATGLANVLRQTHNLLRRIRPLPRTGTEVALD